MGITVHIFTRSLLESICCVALVVCMSSDRNRCVNNQALERDPILYSHLQPAGQSCCKVDMNVGLFVSESYRNGQTELFCLLLLFSSVMMLLYITPKLNATTSAKTSYPVEKEINTYFVTSPMSEGLM